MSMFDDYEAPRKETALALSPQFLDVAACPACHAKLAVDYDAAALVCTNAGCGLTYPVIDGIPILLIDKARRPGRTAIDGEVAGDVFGA